MELTAMNRLQTHLGDWVLDNPIIPASGTFGYGQEFARFYDLDLLGSISIKGTTLQPRLGNPLPRIAECPAGLLNAVGLQNPGAQAVAQEELPQLAQLFHKPVVANISGFSLEDYVEATKILDPVANVGLLEINISCPNVKGGGMAFGMDPQLAEEVTRAVKAVASKPVYMKLSPNAPDIVEVAQACQEGGADGLALVNTFLGMRIDLKTQRPLLKNQTGGLSGPAIFPLALRMVYAVAQAVDLPIIGMGGVASARDVLEMMLAGASAVEVGAANLVDPLACPKILEDLPRVMDTYGIDRLEDIIGQAHEAE